MHRNQLSLAGEEIVMGRQKKFAAIPSKSSESELPKEKKISVVGPASRAPSYSYVGRRLDNQRYKQKAVPKPAEKPVVYVPKQEEPQSPMDSSRTEVPFETFVLKARRGENVKGVRIMKLYRDAYASSFESSVEEFETSSNRRVIV